MIVKGKDLTLSVVIDGGQETFLHAQNCTLSVDVDLLESTTKDGGRAKRFEYSTYTFSLSLTGISAFGEKANFLFLIQAAINGVKLQFSFNGGTDAPFECSGTVLIPHVDIDSPHDSYSSFKGELQGDGEFNIIREGQVITGFDGIWDDDNNDDDNTYEDI